MSDEQTRLVVVFEPSFHGDDNFNLWEILSNPKYELIDCIMPFDHILGFISGVKFHHEGENIVFTKEDKTFTLLRNDVLRIYEQETEKVLWGKRPDTPLSQPIDTSTRDLHQNPLDLSRLRGSGPIKRRS